MDVEALVAFLRDLDANNNKAWFEANTQRYKALRAGFTDVVQEIIYTLGAVDDRVQGLRADKALFRMQRDLRFARDKKPYKSDMSMALSPDARKVASPIYYMQVDHRGMWLYAAGVHTPEPALATRMRTAIAAHALQVERILAAPDLQAAFPAGLVRESYKRAPRGFDESTPLIAVVKSKSFALYNEQPVAPGLTGAQMAFIAMQGFVAAYPWMQFLRDAAHVS